MRPTTHSLLVLSLLLASGCTDPPLDVLCDGPGLPDCAEPGAFFPTAQVDPEYVHTTLTGPTAHSIGHEVVAVGDVDGDGLADLLVVAVRDDDATRGSVLLYLGADLAGGEDLGPVDAHAQIVGLGLEAATAGDVDGDGQADALIGGADGWYLFTGSTLTAGGELGADDADADFGGTDGRALLGAAGGGDIDGDGVDDLVLSELNDKDSGRDNEEVYVFSGADLSLPAHHTLEDGQGAYGAVVDGQGNGSVTVLGDFDDDGLADFATGAIRNFGAVHLGDSVGGNAGLSDKEVHFHDCHPDDESCPDGVRVRAAGDVDADGRDDLILESFPDQGAWVLPGVDLVGSRYNTHLVGGEHIARTLIAGAARLSAAGDIDHDDRADLLADDGQTAWLIAGAQIPEVMGLDDPKLDVSEAMHEFTGFPAGAVHAFGAGDVDGDGRADLMIGCPGGTEGQLFLILTPEFEESEVAR